MCELFTMLCLFVSLQVAVACFILAGDKQMCTCCCRANNLIIRFSYGGLGLVFPDGVPMILGSFEKD